jgi:lysozyme
MSEQWIDVSAHQGVIDWPRVAASGIKGAIIRAGYGNSLSQQDKQFAANISGAVKAGLKATVYYFSYADSAADAKKEWDTCRQIIAPYRKNILFVASDYEYDSYNYYKRVHGVAPSNALINQMVNAFLSAAKADGWGTMLYTNNDYRRNIFSAATLATWDVWLADYTGGPDIPCAMQQTGSTGTVPGIVGNVDTDVCFKDYGTQPGYTCDTSGTVEIEMGGCYTAKTTGDVTLIAGQSPTSARVRIVRCVWPKWTLWHIVPLGNPGQDVGIYAQGGPRLFVVKIK